jgi:TRAP-type C4-dicarboxylate transport system permease large subunit
MLIAITVMIGVVIPPVAMNVFVVKNITKVPFGMIYRGVVPFLAGLVLARPSCSSSRSWPPCCRAC